jgi:hypothetical protein
MKRQQWTVSRRPVGHAAAQRRWDRAYCLLLQATAAPPGAIGISATPQGVSEESRHARSRLCPGFDATPGPGADH